MTAATIYTTRTTPDGFIIVAVLWISAALATLVSIYAIYISDTANAFTLHDDQLKSEALVSAALELTAYQLTATAGPSRPTHGGFNFRLGKANIAVSFQSEAARIDLNTAPKELLAGLFAMLDTADKAANYADEIVRWRTPPAKDQGSSLANQGRNTPDAAAAALFAHVDELSLVPGLPTTVVEQALPFVTVYSGRPQVNIVEAAPTVLAALPGMVKDRLDAVLEQRQVGADGQALLQLLGPARNYATTEASNAARVNVHIAYDNGHRSDSQVIILPFDEGTEPYAVLSSQDALQPATDEPAGIAWR